MAELALMFAACIVVTTGSFLTNNRVQYVYNSQRTEEHVSGIIPVLCSLNMHLFTGNVLDK